MRLPLHLPSTLGACLVAGFMLASSASAQGAADAPLAQPLTLSSLIKLVGERSPRLAAERVSIDAAEADRISAGALPNPRISYGQFRPSGGGRTLFDGNLQQQAAIDLPLLVTGQRGARIEAADLGIAAARARVGAAGSDIAWQAAQLFNALQAAQEKARLMEEAVHETQRIVDIVSGRLQSGAASRYELARVEVELAGVTQRLADARADLADRAAALAALLDYPGWRPVAGGTAQPSDAAAQMAMSIDTQIAQSPQLIAARRDIEVAEAAVRKIDAEQWPVPVLSLGRTWTNDPFGAANFIGLSTEIPLQDARRGMQARAQADLRAAQRRLAVVQAEVGGEYRRIAEGLQLRLAALEKFQRSVADRMPSLKQMSEDAYRLGRAPILDMLDAGRARLDAVLLEVDLRAAAAEQELRLLALSGRLGSS